METQTPDDSSGLVFAVTDLLRGARYFVAERGAQYEIEVPGKAGYAKVAVPRDADVIDVADQLIRLLDNADPTCFTPYASPNSSSSRDLRT
jgi:hypothetical protein